MGSPSYPAARDLDDQPLVVPSSMVYYTALPRILAIKNPTLLRDVVAVLHYVDQKRTDIFQALMRRS